MGMAASQARLLSITARQHDVEYKAQAIQHAKIQLATQQDQVYQEYQAALDAATLTLTAIDTKSGAKSTVAATFNNLFSSNRLTPATRAEYALFDRHGRLVVEDNVYQLYYNFIEEDSGFEQTPEMFAMYMIFGGNINSGNIYTSENFAYYEKENIYTAEQQQRLTELRQKIMNMLGLTEPEHITDPNDLQNIYDTNNALTNDPDFDMEEYQKLVNQYLRLLYSGNGGNTIYRDLYAVTQGINYSDVPEDENLDTALFNYYKHIFQMAQSCGGCVSIDDFNGFNGDAKTDAEWLTSMIASGLMSISLITEDKEGIHFDGTAPSSDQNLQYMEASKIDSAAVKKAEAKYEHDLKVIDRKDKKFDLDLSKLDTERNALKTEYDSVKKVIQDNIERTFGIFS